MVSATAAPVQAVVIQVSRLKLRRLVQLMTFELHPLVDNGNATPFSLLIGDDKVRLEFRQACEKTEFFWSGNYLRLRQLSGGRMTDSASLFREFDAALQFREFGFNWDALEDWLGWLGWMSPGAGYVLLITDAARVLEAEPAERSLFIDILRDTAAGWAVPLTEGSARGRPATPFHVVLSDSSPDEIAEVWGRIIPEIVRS